LNSNDLKLRGIMASCFNLEVSQINDESSVDDIEEWDSLKHLTLVISLEEAFNISFTMDQTVEILSLQLIKIVLAEHGVDFS
jgi:acyl carrier protein